MPSVVPIPQPLPHSTSQRGANTADAAVNSAGDSEFQLPLSRNSSLNLNGHPASGDQVNGEHTNDSLNGATSDRHTVDIDTQDFNRLHGDRKPPLPITIKFVDLRNTVKIEGKTTWSLKHPFVFKRQPEIQKEILHGVTGSVVPGETLAIMGPSGSGKTTLLNLLGGRNLHGITGQSTYNDLPYNKTLKRRMGFVTQDDVLYAHLTVRETLVYAALLRLPTASFTRAQKVARADEAIVELGLERCRDTVIGGPFFRGVSGGERKRVSIGHEILVDPSLLFLDEPTSGLDSTTALRIIQVIRNIAKAGRTVLTTIHQPSSRLFYMFDKLILLSQGNSIYFGNAKEAPAYFASIGLTAFIAMNPADFILDLASGNLNDISIPPALEGTASAPTARSDKPLLAVPSPAEVHSYLVQRFEQELLPKEKSKLLSLGSTKEEHKLGVTAKRVWPTSWTDQFSVLMIRGLKERRHEYLSYLRFIQCFFISVIVGCLWFRSKRNTEAQVADQMGLIFFFAIFWGMFPLFTAIFTFPQERAMLNKERASDLYRLSSYFLARTLGDLPLDLVMPTIFVLIVYFMTNLKLTAAAFFLTLLTVFLNVVTSQGLGFLIGAVMMDVKQATTLASIVMLSFMLTGGFFVQHIPVWMKWLKYISFNYYNYRLLTKVQFSSSEKFDCNTPTGCEGMATAPAFHGMHLGGGGIEAMALLIMVVGYRFLAYFALRRLNTPQ